MGKRTRVELGALENLEAHCESCFGLCCVALAFAKSADFPFNKLAGDPCENLDEHDACRIRENLRPRGFKGCTVFDCFGAGKKVSGHTFAGRSWRDDPQTRGAMFTTFPIVRRLHELLWYLDQAITVVQGKGDPAPLLSRFEHVRALSNQQPSQLAALDIDAEFDTVRPLLIEASVLARGEAEIQQRDRHGVRRRGPGSDLVSANLAMADLRGLTLRGALLIGADLSDAKLGCCDVLSVDMRDANLSGADLEGAIYLTQMQVNSARGDDATLLPTGFGRPSHWRAE